jgi:hypothetical protein
MDVEINEVVAVFLLCHRQRTHWKTLHPDNNRTRVGAEQCSCNKLVEGVRRRQRTSHFLCVDQIDHHACGFPRRILPDQPRSLWQSRAILYCQWRGRERDKT